MNYIPPTVFAGAYCLVIAVRFLAVGEYQPESAVLIAVSLILIVNAHSIQKRYRQLSRLFRGLIAGGLMLLLVLLGAKSLDFTASTQVIAEGKDLLSVPH
ncbi:MAG: hypothetical protein WEB37_05525 [Bacteroidota bacterium]